MLRRDILRIAGALALGPAAALLAPSRPFARQRLRFADMHSHLGLKLGSAMREAMTANGMLIIAEKMIPDSPFIRFSRERQRLAAFRDAGRGELRRSFDVQFSRTLERMRAQNLLPVDSVEALDRVRREHVPGIALASEGADFLEGDIGYLEKIRGRGLVHLQLLHYRISDIGDISTEEPENGGLTAFGKEVVRACNRLGILLDIAHATSAGIEQVLEISSRPVIYSHGHVSSATPLASQGGIAARAIHAPLARQLAAKGGVIGLWPLWYSYANLDLYADELTRMVDAYGASHVGIGSDMFGLGRSTMPSYAEFAQLPDYLAKRGLKDADVDAVLGGNYLRLLRQALVL
ncbi:MAG: membrane dipeptidase [Betaproteobacteria bacterium]|nr:membrane dipeptidase [Betaproteobacteria bacterium]